MANYPTNPLGTLHPLGSAELGARFIAEGARCDWCGVVVSSIPQIGIEGQVTADTVLCVSCLRREISLQPRYCEACGKLLSLGHMAVYGSNECALGGA